MIWLKKKSQDTEAAQESQQDVSEILKCIKGEIVGSQVEDEKSGILELTELVEQQVSNHSKDPGSGNNAPKSVDTEKGSMKFGDNYVSDDVGHFLHIIKNDDKNLMHNDSADDTEPKDSSFSTTLKNNVSSEPAKDLNPTETLSAANVPDPWRKLIEATLKDWMDENLPKIVSRIVEERIETILKKI